MITGSIHQPVASLSTAQLVYRKQLDNQLSQNSSKSSPSQLPSVDPPADNPDDKKLNLDIDKIQENAQTRKDTSRQAAVHLAGLQQKQKLFDIYIDSSSDSDSSKSSQTTINPGELYKESMTYLRRQDLISAFEQAAKGNDAGQKINTVV